MSIVTVDFDGTLYLGNSLMAMFKTSKKELTLKQWYLIIVSFLKLSLNKKYKNDEDLRVVFLRAFFSQMKGKNENELHTFFMSVIENGQHGINDDMVFRITEHLDRGDRVIILSGALQPFLEIFIQHLNIQADAIGTSLILDDNGICTGEIGKLNHGVKKVDSLKHWIEINNFDEESTWAYADSESDLPLLEFVDKAIVVNPSNEMKMIVQSKGWEVFDNLDLP